MGSDRCDGAITAAGLLVYIMSCGPAAPTNYQIDPAHPRSNLLPITSYVNVLLAGPESNHCRGLE